MIRNDLIVEEEKEHWGKADEIHIRPAIALIALAQN